jgi:hypothetical protein
MARRTSVTSFSILAAGVLCGGAVAAPPGPQGAGQGTAAVAQLEGLTVKVASVRTWTSFDGKTPVLKRDERWTAGAMKIQTFTDPIYGASRLSSGTREMSQGKDRYAATLESFAVKGAPKAAGRYCEIAVVLTNGGAQAASVSWLDAASKTLDARLLLPAGTAVPLRAFLIPGVGAARTSLVKSFDGKLAMALAPGEETWALLVFDVPAGQSQARLQLKKAPPVSVSLP